MLPLWNAALEAISHREYTDILGWLLAVCMMLGAALDGNGRRLFSWTAAVLTTGLLTQMSRWMYWNVHGMADIAVLESAITIISVIVCLAGLTIGWGIAQLAQRRARRHRTLTDDRVLEISTRFGNRR